MVRRKRNQTAKKKASTPTKAITPQVNAIPEFIEGIPTKKSCIKERRELITEYYNSLWKRLQRENNSNYIYNEFLQAKIYIVKGESDKKTVFESSKTWQSTHAVKHLYKIVKNARPLSDNIEFTKPKDGTQTKNGYKQMLILYYQIINDTYDYLNYTAKLTIGIKADGKHIQYAINKIEINK